MAQPEPAIDTAPEPVAATGIDIAAVESKADLDRFIKVPWPIYAGDPNWVPPLMIERRGHLSSKSNPFYRHADVRLWLALRDGRPVGRISAQVNHAYLKRHQDATGHFGFIEAEDDPAVFAALLGQAESWLAEQGMRRIRGPFCFSVNDELGLLVDGFDRPPSLLMGHARPYYGSRMEQQGYVKAKDLIAYDFGVADNPLPKSAKAILSRLERDPSVTVRGLRKSDYSQEVEAVLDIFNDAWSDNWGFVPMADYEIAHLAKELKVLIYEDFVAIAEVDGAPAAFGIGLPNINEAIADLNGALLPFGWAKLLYRLKGGKIRSARLPLMGVRKQYHGTPLGVALAFGVIDRLHRNHAAKGYRQAELSWILEDNQSMRAIIEAAGAEPYKTYRIYEKDL